jgi:hypothetical protein
MRDVICVLFLNHQIVNLTNLQIDLNVCKCLLTE